MRRLIEMMPLEERFRLFERLLAELPATGSGDDPDVQTRAVLGPIVDRIVNGLEPTAPIPADPSTCPNCGAPCDALKTPYCSVHCREMAAFIRQFRSSVLDGVIFAPDRQIGMGQALWNVQGGGFPRRQQLVPAKVIAKVIERDGGVCAVCGAPATEIDHTGSG